MTKAGTGHGRSTAAPPAIPACHLPAADVRGSHLLLWVHSGEAWVSCDDGIRTIVAGQGIWLPDGSMRWVRTAPGAVAVPHLLAPTTTTRGPSHCVPFSVPDGWRDWLLLNFAHHVSPIDSMGLVQSDVLDVLLNPIRRPVDDPVAPTPQIPPLPVDAAARTVAQLICLDPALDRSLEEWAAISACSVSTLRRQFLRTGHTFAEWRTRTRLAIAATLLSEGHRVEHVATLVGFKSRNGFARAFGRASGHPPSLHAPDRSGATVRSVPGAAPRRRDESVADPVAPSSRHRLPPGQTPRHSNSVHVLTWTYRGEGYVRFPDAICIRRRGDAVWIPAGVDHQAGTNGDSISLPVGDLGPGEARIGTSLRTHFAPSWDPYLLHRSVSLRTPLRPTTFDRREMLDVFRSQVLTQRERQVPMPREGPARAAATDFLDGLRSPRRGTVEPGVHAAFLADTGLTFAQWQNAARLRVAFELLENGVRPSAIARRIGYAHLRNFTRAFTRATGMPPSRYAAAADRG